MIGDRYPSDRYNVDSMGNGPLIKSRVKSLARLNRDSSRSENTSFEF